MRSFRCATALLAVACGATRASAPAMPAGPALGGLEREVHERVNAHRATRGLSALVFDSAVASVARRFSARMARGDAPLEHVDFAERASAIGRRIEYSAVAENLGLNNRPSAETARAVVASWLRSPSHRLAIEGPFDVTGVGVATDERGVFYFTQIFVARRR